MYEYISETAKYQYVFLGNPRKFIYTPLQQPRQSGPPKGRTAASVYFDVNYFRNNSISSVKQLLSKHLSFTWVSLSSVHGTYGWNTEQRLEFKELLCNKLRFT
jgi:hypothetical protein